MLQRGRCHRLFEEAVGPRDIDAERAGGTVEAAGVNLGVRRDRIEGRLWNYVVKVPGIAYASTGYVAPVKPLPYLLTLETPCIKSALVRSVQRALRDKGVDPGKIDGEYGPHTVAAVEAFQAMNRLVAYLMENCCAGADCGTDVGCQPTTQERKSA